MKAVTHPVRRSDQNEKVANLHATLLLLTEKRVIEFNANQHATVVESLSGQQRDEILSRHDGRAVKAFQQQHEVNFTGDWDDVDELTAEALNRFLTELGANQEGY
jgi:hypothetical protein